MGLGSRRLRLLVLLLLWSAVLYLWWPQAARLIPAKPSPPHFIPQVSMVIPSEELWVVSDVANGIAETIAFAATRKTPALAQMQFQAGRGLQPKEYRFEMRLGQEAAQTQVVVANYLWAPENFVPVARELIQSWRPAGTDARSPVDREMILRLITPTPDTLVREDKRLSEALTKSPLDAELHEEAALLLGCFALRHAAASFYDVRRELSRLTAHLAMARALGDHRGPCGDLAEAILHTLTGRQTPALEIMQRLERDAGVATGLPLDANAIWGRALALRNTGDYRKVEQPRDASLLERLELVRALQSRIDSTAASAFLMTFRAENLAEWSNVVLSGSFSVGDGHMWAERAVKAELDEIASAYRQYHSQRLEDNEWSGALNAPIEHIAQAGQEPAHLEVLGWGSWAALHQRQLCQAIKTTWDWLDDDLGLPKDAQTFKTKITERFGELRLLPFVEMEHGGKEESRRAFAARVQPLIRAHPEWVPFGCWPQVMPQAPVRKNQAKREVPVSIWSWFSPMLPMGTLYDSLAREKTGLVQMQPKDLEQSKALAPYNHTVLYYDLLRAKQSGPKPEDFEAQFASLTAYDTFSMQAVANAWKGDPDRYEAAFLPLCRFNPDSYVQLGNYLSTHDRPEAAVKAYQNAIERAPDRVYLSNNVRWLVNYYYDHGRRDEAFKVAEMAADVYSYAGLETMGCLLERDKQLRQAEDYFDKIAKRYDKWSCLALFYARHRGDDPHFADACDRLTSKIFPKGQEHVDVATLSGPPADGIALTGSSAAAKSAGLQPGNVIVAINGVRVHDSQQYYFVLDSATSSRIEFGFWSGKNYRSVSIDLPEHRLGATISDRKAP